VGVRTSRAPHGIPFRSIRMTPTRFLARLVVVVAVATPGGAHAADGTTAVASAAPPASVTLDDALSLALRFHPALAAGRSEMDALEADAAQAARRPNPELAVEVENLAGTGELEGLDAAETTVGISQAIELGGKRARREEAARRGGEAAARDLHLTRIDVLSETAASFAEVLAAQERTALADTLVAVAERVLASVSRRLEAGGVSPVEERRARVSLETSRVARDRSERALEVARARLAASWGSGSPRFERAVGELKLDGSAAPDLDSLAARVPDSPRVMRHASEVDSRRADRAVAAAAGVPDLTVGAGVRRFHGTDDTALVAGVSLPLPLFDRNRDAVAAAERRIAQAEEHRRGEEVRVKFALREAHAELAAAVTEAAALRDRILPEAELAFTESHEAYLRGRLRLTDVLDAERSLFDLQSRYVDVLAEYHVAAAEIGRLLGDPIVAAPPAEDR
jgi:cobalt-zinc-cadmium efflux system outer membrane protein